MSLSLVSDLEALGFFAASFSLQGGDFVLQDDSDGSGLYIREWLSAQPCPFPDLLREPHPAEQDNA